MNRITALGVTTLLLSLVAAARAGNAIEVKLDAAKLAVARSKRAPDGDACTSSATASQGASDQVTVKLSAKLPFALSVSALGKTYSMAAGATELALDPGAYAGETLRVVAGGTGLCDRVMVAASSPAAPAPTPSASRTPVTVDRAATGFVALDQRARDFLRANQLTEHVVARGGATGRTFRIYHLPSGTPAFPLPRHVNEKDDVELWLVLPEGASASVEVSSCDDVPALRVAGSYKSSAAARDKIAQQSAENEPTAPAFRLEPYAKRLTCAGTLTYKVEVQNGDEQASTATSIAFDPVYRFEWGVGYMFDFGRQSKYTLADRPTDDGGSEKFLVRSNDTTGARPIIALGVNVCGTNPKELTWCDRLVNPTLILDPQRLTAGFGLGLTVRPFHGIGLLAGVTVFQRTVLADGLSVKPGDTWTLPGDPPTKEVFDKDSVGFLLAAVVSTDVFAALSRSGDE